VSASKSESVATVENAIRPLTLRFPAYCDKLSFKEILKVRLQFQQDIDKECLRISESKSDPLVQISSHSVVSSFLDTVIQSLLGTTRDVRDMLRMSRYLWPKYTTPIEKGNIEKTMTIVRQRLVRQTTDNNEHNPDLLQKELLQYLDEKVIRHTASWIENCLGLMGNQKQAKHEMSYVTKCLLLAGFMCQHNKAEKDRNLFTNQRSGKANHKNSNRLGEGVSEAAAFADTTWDQQRLKMLRPRAFALERMLSVFVNIVGVVQAGDNLIHPEVDGDDSNVGQIIRLMGTPVFFESLAQLRDMGLLREVSGNRVVGGVGKTVLNATEMNSPMYCCDLDDDQAKVIAESIKLTLSDYLIN
jgi:Origin recognition complex (ORC) subunit 5 C-terminus